MQRAELERHLDQHLEAARFRDYCPNGLQVEGRAEVNRIICGVTASQDLIGAAIAAGADAILVHHGWFWRGEDGRVNGIRKSRLKALLAHDISLFAYHLPLDAHAELGNNAQLAKRMGWTIEGRFAEQDVGFLGSAPGAATAGELAQQLAAKLGRAPMLVGDAARRLRRIAWCSGGAQGWFEQAIASGADAYVSGEISEQTVHLARESGVPYIAAGHHATERYGVRALGAHLEERFGLECRFVDIDNPV
ncbi:MAG: Nif3-like dinuclear metal center hexameric protein [Rhodocyclaceae bacterium]|jgi:dinuclear metal center YbgI/SA1388 family protein|nr:Nif3-like dinuclear metal center hexameric protein [Rhodocyclaceae bacterium]